MRAILLAGGISLLISLIGTRYAIRQFTKMGYGQEVRDDGPTTHHVKRGTPTMGGVVLIGASVIGYFAAKIITVSTPSASALLLLLLFVGTGLVGFLDDFIKIYKQRSLGLRSKAKIVGQTVVGLAFGILALSPLLEDDRGQRPASFSLSFIRDFVASGKPVAAICHAPWTLIEAGVLEGRTLTSWPSLQTDIRNAGGTWVDEAVVTDGNLITSRNPGDIPSFNNALLEAVAHGAGSTGS